jgi:two-component system response regulator YesN
MNSTNHSIQIDPFEYYPRLRRVKAYVEDHLHAPIRLGEVAEAVGLSRTYFSKYFSEKTGSNFSDWLIKTRVHKAKEMLEEQDFSIAHVASSSGYQDMRTFERNFKRVTGMTAMQYKKSCRGRLAGAHHALHQGLGYIRNPLTAV